jgi:8-oxo-dGTP pyrophosphatase MutT (NUDIX family)
MMPSFTHCPGAAKLLLDRLYRMTYWLGFRVLRLVWTVAPTEQHGALIAVWAAGKVLIVTSSYRPHMSFPGGTIETGETPAAAARRELREEVGLDAPLTEGDAAFEMTIQWEGRPDHVVIFEWHLAETLCPEPDGREIVAAEFLTPTAALALSLTPHVRAYLTARR